MIVLAPDAIDPAVLLADFARAAADAGAIVSFTGVVRSRYGDQAVTSLWLDHHEQLTRAAFAAIDHAARQRFAIDALAIVHRVGSVAPGEPIIFVAAAARHRRAAFDAVDFAMDRLKTDVPLWKCETRGDDRIWIEARPEDHADAARWEERLG